MNRSELEQALLDTLAAISQIKEQIDQTGNSQDAHHLWRKLKELRYLQLWQMEKLERLSD